MLRDRPKREEIRDKLNAGRLVRRQSPTLVRRSTPRIWPLRCRVAAEVARLDQAGGRRAGAPKRLPETPSGPSAHTHMIPEPDELTEVTVCAQRVHWCRLVRHSACRCAMRAERRLSLSPDSTDHVSARAIGIRQDRSHKWLEQSLRAFLAEGEIAGEEVTGVTPTDQVSR